MTCRPLLALAAAAAAAAGCQKPMTEFTSQEYKFKAMFPGKPRTEQRLAGGVTLKAFLTEDRDGAFMVGVADMPIGENDDPRAVREMLQGVQNGAIGGVGGSLKSGQEVTLDGKYPGREFSASITQPKAGQVRARVYLVGRRLYQVMVLGTDSYATSPRSTQFLDSFKVIP